MHTVQSADDPDLQADLVFRVVLLDEWVHPDEGSDGILRVYAEGDPEWLFPRRLASFDDMSHRMWVYKKSSEDPHQSHVIMLEDAERARPAIPLTDPRCPTLVLVNYLRTHGWVAEHRYIEHTAIVPLTEGPPFDSREAVRMKTYYQVLTKLPTCLPLAGGLVPSQCPIGFYKLLLQGLKAVPFQSAKTYALEYNRAVKPGKKDALPIEGEPEPPPPDALLDEVFVLPVGAPEPKQRAASSGVGIRGRGRGSAGSGRGGSGGGKGGAPAPEPLPLPPPHPVPGPVCPGPGGAAGPGLEDEVFIEPEAPRARPRQERDKLTWIPGLGQCLFAFDPYTAPGGKYSPNFQVQCPHHENCFKSRGDLPQWKAQYGQIEIIAFLKAWSDVPWPTVDGKRTHRLETPKPADVRAVAEANVDELQAIVARLRS